MSEQETVFADGIYLNTVSEKAPEFIKANVSIHLKKAQEWLYAMEQQGMADEKGYIKLVGKESKQGKRYLQLDTWKPEQKRDAFLPDADGPIESPF